MRVARWSVAVVVLWGACERADDEDVSRVRIEYEHYGWGHQRRICVVEAGAGRTFSSGGRTIDRSLVEGVAQAAVVNLQPSDGMSSCNSHTDDGPHFHVAIEGKHPVELFSTSNCSRNAPWNVVRDGELLVQYDASVARPLYALLALLDPSHWAPLVPTNPFAERLMLGGAPVDEREPPPAGVKRATSRAVACMRSAEASSKLRAALGGPIAIKQLSVGCDAERDPVCRRTVVTGRMAWRGFDLTLPFSCVDDALEIASVSTQLAAVMPFVDSKVFAAWRGVAGLRGTLEPEDPGAWRLRSASAPEITYYVQTGALDVNAQGKAADAPFWIDLGIDPSTRVYEGPENFQSNRAWLDLDGHVLPDIGPAK